MRAILISVACCSFMTLAAFGDESFGKNEERSISELILEYSILARQVGRSHPSTELLHRKIEDCIDDGENKLEQGVLSNTLEGSFRKYREFREQVGLTHPSTQKELHKIAIASRLMLAKVDVTHSNLEGLLADSRGFDSFDKETRRTKR